MRLPDYLRRAHKLSTREGWTWDHKDGSKHLTIFNADGVAVTTVSLSAYDGSLTKKVRSQLRRAKCPGIQ